MQRLPGAHKAGARTFRKDNGQHGKQPYADLQHASCLVRTGIASVKSPWLAGVEVGDIFTIPVSHGEGRFIADDQLLDTLAKNGQIATQYVDFDGEPSMDISFNPNGSAMAVEGITSPDGGTFGESRQEPLQECGR